MKEVTFRGVFLTSADAAKTAAFYRDVGCLPLEQNGSSPGYVYWKLDKDGMQLAIHEARAFADYAHPPFAQSNVTHLYFKIVSQKEFLVHLQKLGVQPVRQDDVVVTVTDPDGRQVMFGIA